MKVKFISLTSLQNMEHFQFAGHILAMCRETNIAKLNPVLASLQTALAAEIVALKLPRQEEETKKLEELDKVRGRAYRSLQLLVELHLYSDDTAIRASAKRVSEILASYPKMLTANYDKESGMFKNLITDLRTTEMTIHVKRLAAKPYIDRLEKTNTAFDTRYRSCLKNTIPTGIFNIKALRAATDIALNAVLRRIDSLDDLVPITPKLAELITQYNTLVDKMHATLAHRTASSQTTYDKRIASYEAMLKPVFAALEQFLQLPAGSLSFTGKTEGTGNNRHYQLVIEGKTDMDGKPKTIWMGIDKNGGLYTWEKADKSGELPTGIIAGNNGEMP